MTAVKSDDRVRITSDGTLHGTRVFTESGDEVCVQALTIRLDARTDEHLAWVDVRLLCRMLDVQAKVGTVTTVCLCCGADRAEGSK